MKRFFTLLSFVAVAMLSACDPAPIDESKPGDPATLNIDDNLIQVKSNGGLYAFTYTLENPDGSELKAESAADWIHSFDLSIEGEVSFTVDANTAAESRIANLYLKYGKAEDKIVVSQSGIAPGDIEYEFEVNYDIDGPYVDMNVKVSPDGTRYFAWYYPKETLEEALAQSPGVSIEQYLNRWVEVDLSDAIYYGAYAGYTAEQAVAEITFVGESTQSFELNGESDFYGFVCAVSDGGERLSDVEVSEFRTGAVKPSSNQIGVEVGDINSDRFDYTITTTNDDQYAVIVFPTAEVENLTDTEIVAMFNDIDNYIPYLHRNGFSTTALVEKEDSDYSILAFGYEYGMATTEIKRVNVHTLKYDPTATAEFQIDIKKVTNFRIKATVDATPKTCLYYADYCYEGETAEELMAMVHEAAQWYVDNGYFNSLAASMKSVCLKGKRDMEFTGLEPESNYRIFAVGVDELTGEFNTEVFFTEIITTPARELSEGYIEISVDDYFYDFDLAEAYPEEFTNPEGWAVVPLEVNIHGDVVDYYYDIYTDDLTDTTYAPDEGLILDLEANGIHNKPLIMSYCYFESPLTLVYFSKDSNDNFSAVTRVPLMLFPAGCSPVEDFKYGDAIETRARSFKK